MTILRAEIEREKAMIEWKKENTGLCAYEDGKLLVLLKSAGGASDSVEEIENNVWRWRRHTAAPTDHMRMEMLVTEGADFTMVPGISYNGNGWGNFPEYVGDRDEDGTPWSWAWHRTTIPSCTYSENARISAALMAEANSNSACSLCKVEDGELHTVIFPEEERPRTLQRHFWGEPFTGTMESACDFEAIVAIWPADERRFRYDALLDFAWRHYGHPLKAPMSSDEIYRLSIAFCRYLFERERNGFAGFTKGAQWHLGTTSYKKTEHRYEMGWVGQNGSMANAYIYDYLQTGDREKLDTAIEVLDAWLHFAKLPAGHIASQVDYDEWRYLPFPAGFEPDRWEVGEVSYESFKNRAGKKFRRAADGQILLSHDACNLGTGAEMYFEAYDLLKKADIEKPEYLRAALDICDFALERQSEDGCYAKSWDDDGNTLVKPGTIGCFLILPMTLAREKTGDDKYGESARKAFGCYYGALERDGFTTAGALDSYSIDKESASPLLRSALALYDMTGERKYVNAAERIAWYLCTWIVHFTVKYPADSLLGSMGIDTFGFTSVSTPHQGCDQYALRDVLSFIRLAELTGNSQWRERAAAFWCAACQCISDGTLYINGRLRPAGAQDEAIFHTRWGRYGVKPFGPSQWLPAWPCAFRLEDLRRFPDHSFFDEGLKEIKWEKE